MKKSYIYILMLIIPYLSFAQVGINTNNPDLSAMLHIFSASKGVSIPKVHLKSLTDKETIPNPKESLLVFNTNGNLLPKEGLYYWNGKKWVVIISERSQFLFENLVKFYTEKDETGYNFGYGSFFNENTDNSTIGTSLSGSNNQWNVISGLTSEIVIDRAENDELYTITGMIQADNNGDRYKYVSSSIGVFIDGKLQAIKPIILEFGPNTKCSYRDFTMSFFSENLSVGKHKVQFAIRNRRANGNRNINFSFGKRNPNAQCNNTLSDDETRMSSSIFINQPFNF